MVIVTPLRVLSFGIFIQTYIDTKDIYWLYATDNFITIATGLRGRLSTIIQFQKI